MNGYLKMALPLVQNFNHKSQISKPLFEKKKYLRVLFCSRGYANTQTSLQSCTGVLTSSWNWRRPEQEEIAGLSAAILVMLIVFFSVVDCIVECN